MYCSNCGAEAGAGGSYCAKCGAPLGPPVAAGVAAGRGVYGGFWLRFVASILDSLLMYLAIFVVFFAIGVASAGFADTSEDVIGLWGSLLGFVGGWLYSALFESSTLQATPGKLAVGLKVATTSGARLSFGRASGRYFAKIISSFTLLVGYVMAAFTRRKQALHDLIAGTVVVRKAYAGAALAAEPAGEGMGAGAIAAIAVVGALVPVGGILAAIAIPAYQDYMIRAQVAEGLTYASDYKVAVADALVSGTDAADIDNAAIGLPLELGGSRAIETIEVNHGVVILRFGERAHPRLRDRELLLVPGRTYESDITWVCGRSPPAPGVRTVVDDYASQTTIEGKYLPSACR